jgi:hypothetical protein
MRNTAAIIIAKRAITPVDEPFFVQRREKPIAILQIFAVIEFDLSSDQLINQKRVIEEIDISSRAEYMSRF